MSKDPLAAKLGTAFLMIIVAIAGWLYNLIRRVIYPPQEVRIILGKSTKQELLNQIGHHPDETSQQGLLKS